MSAIPIENLNEARLQSVRNLIKNVEADTYPFFATVSAALDPFISRYLVPCIIATFSAFEQFIGVDDVHYQVQTKNPDDAFTSFVLKRSFPHARFTTFERVEEVPLLVVKKDGTREQFSRDKIFNGILMSAQKRPVSSEDIENAITRIEQNIRRNHDGEVDSDVIGNLVMKELADLDEITYVRFASVYRSFKDVDEIEELLQEITNTVRAKKESKK